MRGITEEQLRLVWQAFLLVLIALTIGICVAVIVIS
jgi:hypothetical protein